MPAIIFVLRDLLKTELEIISRELPIVTGRAKIPSNLRDPWKDMVEALSSFLDWFIKARSMLFPMEDAPVLQELTPSMKDLLQLHFPEKSGEKSAVPWNFPSRPPSLPVAKPVTP